MDGLKQAIVEMLAGGSIRINTGTFSNDMTSFATRDDIFDINWYIWDILLIAVLQKRFLFRIKKFRRNI